MLPDLANEIHLTIYPSIAIPLTLVLWATWMLWRLVRRPRRFDVGDVELNNALGRTLGDLKLKAASPNQRLKDAKDTIIMALLDDIATQTAAVEATEAAALAKIDDLKAQVATAQAALVAAQGDVAAAQALAERLRVANDALQAKVAA